MAHYRAVMGTTLDCEGCEFDGEQCMSDEGCVALGNKSTTRWLDQKDFEEIEAYLRREEPWMFEWEA